MPGPRHSVWGRRTPPLSSPAQRAQLWPRAQPRLPAWLSQSAAPLTLACVSHSLVSLFLTPWTVACQAPLSMGFSGQKYWSVLPFPPQPMSLTLLPLLVPGVQLPSDTLGLATGSPTPGPP